jgi:hypothetical protein
VNKKKAIEKEVKRHEDVLRTIEFAYRIAKKIKPLLPEGWLCEYFHYLNHLNVSSGEAGKKENKKPSEEFKLVCKILEKMCSFQGRREAEANEETNEISALEARFYFEFKKREEGYFQPLVVEVKQYYPDHKCEIKWEKKSYYTSIVSDECLGLGGE